MMFYSTPPPATPFSDSKPTLLVSWWITIFCTCIIILRLSGRYIRVEALFIEDKIAAAALLPLFLRMACTHIVLLYGTNNERPVGVVLTDTEIAQRITGSRVVLAARVFYAATLWTLKFTTLEFLYRLAGASRRKLYVRLIVGLRYALAVSFLAVVVSDLLECRPLSHYWQISPDPGPKCRQGYIQLLTMGTLSATIDTILAVFPVPIILSTRIATKRKILLVLLFCFGFLTVGITIYRIPQIIQHHGDQVVRSMWASIELLAATTVANLVALGSFLRDSGAKKTKFRPEYGSSGATTSKKRNQTLQSEWDDTASSQQLGSLADKWVKNETLGATSDSQAQKRMRHSASQVRGVSPTESNDSLIGYGKRPISFSVHQPSTSGPKAPPPTVLAAIRQL